MVFLHQHVGRDSQGGIADFIFTGACLYVNGPIPYTVIRLLLTGSLKPVNAGRGGAHIVSGPDGSSYFTGSTTSGIG